MSMLNQARCGIQAIINVNKSIIDVEMPASMVDDGRGNMIPDLLGATTRKRIPCRISFEKKLTDGLPTASVGFSTNLSKFIITDYKNEIKRGYRFDDYEIGEVSILRQFGDIIGYQAPLIESKANV